VELGEMLMNGFVFDRSTKEKKSGWIKRWEEERTEMIESGGRVSATELVGDAMEAAILQKREGQNAVKPRGGGDGNFLLAEVELFTRAQKRIGQKLVRETTRKISLGIVEV